MFSICKQTHPSTGIEHSLTCYFFHRSEKSLVVAGGNVMRVFRLIPDVDPKKKDRYGEGRTPKMKLECMASYTLWSNIASMESVSPAGGARDAILLSFHDAKLSLVEYNPETNDLRTLSLHYFEEDEIRGGWTQNEHRIPILRVDPEDRCAVMLGYGRRLIVLPFRRDPAPEDSDLLMIPPSLQADIKPSPHLLAGGGGGSKAPVLASYSISLRDLDEKIDNVIDVQFLHGYYEPTLLILYEPVRTFPGRLAVRRDTCSMVAISLSLATRVHPSIWSVSGLPFDCLQAVPVRKPLGGTLLLATNSVLYLNQSVPPYGVSVNSIAEMSTNFPIKEQPGLRITLEGAKACFISNDKLVLSLHGGELYVLSLLADSMRSVRGFHFEKAAASVLTTCISLYEENHLFLGSRLGNSLLLCFKSKEHVPTVTINGSGGFDDDVVEIVQEEENTEAEPPTKKTKHLDTLGDCMASNVAEIRDPDELEVYGREDKASVQITSFTFEVCDSLLNIGPCGNVSIGEPAFLSEEFSNTADPDLELVTTAGYGKNGALCVLQRSVRPQIATTFELPGVLDMWTLAAPSKSEETTDSTVDQEPDTMHAFLVLSRNDSTMVLQTGQEINEVDSSGFSTQGPTVYAGNLGVNKYIVQVCQMGVRLLLGTELLQHIPLDLGSPVVHASSADPYLVLLCKDGQLVQLVLKEGRLLASARLAITKCNISCKVRTVALCVYRDVSGLFSGQVPGVETISTVDNIELDTAFKTEHIKREVDDEDELLYGDSEFPIMLEPPTQEPTQDKAKNSVPWWQRYLVVVKPTYWLLLARENGTMEIYSLPECRLNFLVRNVASGPRVLADNLDIVPVANPNSNSNASELPVSQIQELMIVPLGHLGNRPLLFVRLEDEVLIYQAFHYPKGSPMPLRFSRMQHGMLTKERKAKTRKKQAEAEGEEVLPAVRQLRYFRNIAGYNGVFVCGPSPHWVFLTFRGELRAHPMTIDGPIPCFTPFHNVNCSQGFLYFNSKSELRICVLPTHLSYDAPWPCRKVPLRCTPHFVSYHLESKTYCIVTSTSEPSNKVYKFNGEDKELSIEKRNDRFPFPHVQRFSILLFSPVSWEVIPNTSMELDEWEHVTCLKNVSLAYEGTHSGLKGYIAVGTNYNYGEDITSRGRILIYDVIEVVPEPGQPLTKNRFKAVYSKEQKGPVTAITHAMGYLVSAVGQKVYIWQLKDNDLVGVAFIDTQIYIHQMLSIKSLILVADVYKSIALLRFQEEYRTLSLVSRDFRPAEVYTIEFVIDNAQMGFLISDREKNIVLYMYQPESRESLGGQKLVRKADFHVGQHINTFFRVRCKTQPETSMDRRLPVGSEKRHLTMFATLDGGLGYLLPLPEKNYRRLLMLQNVLVNQMCHTAGLNPKAFRTFKMSSTRLLGNAARGIVDGELVWAFLNLPLIERWEVAKKIGTRMEEIIDDILDIERLASHF